MDGTIYEFESLPMVSQRPGVAAAPSRTGLGPAGGLIGVIRNPRSHRNKGHAPEMAERPDVITRTPRTREALARDLAEMASLGIAMLAVDGGDGTVRDVMTCGASCFGENWPRMIVLPKGKTNALAVDLGLPNHWSLAEALAAAKGPGVERRPVVVNGAGEQGGSIIGFFLGAGIFTTATNEGQVAHRYGAFNSFAVGLTAVSGILQGLFGTGHRGWRGITPIRLLLDAEEREVAHSEYGPNGSRYAILISTLNDFPLGIKPFGRQQPDGLKYLLVDYPLRRVVALAPALLAGWEGDLLRRLGVHRGHAQEAIFEVGDTFILDGEAFPAGRYHLTLGPKLNFVAP